MSESVEPSRAKPRKAVRVAMVQMLVEGGRPEANLRRAAAGIREASSLGAEIALLPECLDLGWTDPSALDLAQPIPGPNVRALTEAARDSGITVVAGLVERAGDTIYNSAILIGPNGDLLGLHRKINELAVAQEFYSTGDVLQAFDFDYGRSGLTICADNLPESLELGHSLARMGARFILSPCAWAVDGDHDNAAEPYGELWLRAYRELAARNGISVVGVSAVGWIDSGPWRGRKLIGCSLAVGPDGEVLGQAPYGVDAESISLVELP